MNYGAVANCWAIGGKMTSAGAQTAHHSLTQRVEYCVNSSTPTCPLKTFIIYDSLWNRNLKKNCYKIVRELRMMRGDPTLYFLHVTPSKLFL